MFTRFRLWSSEVSDEVVVNLRGFERKVGTSMGMSRDRTPLGGFAGALEQLPS